MESKRVFFRGSEDVKASRSVAETFVGFVFFFIVAIGFSRIRRQHGTTCLISPTALKDYIALQ